MSFNGISAAIHESDRRSFLLPLILLTVFFSLGQALDTDSVYEEGPSLIQEVQYTVQDLEKIGNIVLSEKTQDSEPEARRVIMIDVDTLGANHVGAYGYSKNTTPFIDSFAERNTVFLNTLAPASWTRASQMSVFTSTYPRTHGFLVLRHRAPDEFNTIAEEFKEEGYRTGAFTGGIGMKDGLGFEQGFDNYTSYEKNGYLSFNENFERAFRFMNNSRNKPSFTFIHGYDVHDPYGDTPGAEKYDIAGYKTPISKNRLLHANGSAFVRGPKGTRRLDSQDIAELRKAYDQDVKNTDRLLRNFTKRLKSRGLYENSTIVLYSSHGENLANNVYQRPNGEPEAFGHVFLWPETTQVPMIIKSPGIEPGREKQPVSLTDIAPTLYDLANIAVDPKTRRQLTGKSLIDYKNKNSDPEFSETKHVGNVAVNKGQYKLIDRKNKDDVLYRRNGSEYIRLELEENSKIYRELLSMIEAWRNKTPETYESSVKIDFRSDLVKSLVSSNQAWLFRRADRPLKLDDIVIRSSQSFTVESELDRDTASGKVKQVKASNGEGRELEISIFENRSEQFAEKYMKQEREQLISVYRGAEPYGFRSGAEVCGEEFQPDIEAYDEKMKLSIRFYADSEGFKGACRETASRKITVYIGYCREKGTLYRIEDSMPNLNETDRLGVACK